MTGIRVRGNATPEELAAVFAVLARTAGAAPAPDPYTAWRTLRQNSLPQGATAARR
jgi:hypothetical protein